MFARRLLRWFGRHARDLPWRRTQDPYAIWVSEVMLQQTQVKTVVPYWERWMRELPDIAALAGASTAKVHKLWEGLGYYTRVRNMQKAAQVVQEKHGGSFPSDYSQVLALPGVGPYTAGAVCSIALNQPRPILDGNVVRVLCRFFGIGANARKASTRAQLWRRAEGLVLLAAAQGSAAKRPASAFNQALMELGALVCTPRQPRCPVCPVAGHCVAHREGRVEELPRLGPRAPVTPRRFAAFVVQRRGRFLVRQRPAGVVNAHLWEFPNVEMALDGGAKAALPLTRNRARKPLTPSLSPSDGERVAAGRVRGGLLPMNSDREALLRAARSALGLTASGLAPLCTIRHSITRYRVTLEAFRASGPVIARDAGAKGKWLTAGQLRRLAFSSAHRRILRHLGS